jgi:hypothetical protein
MIMGNINNIRQNYTTGSVTSKDGTTIGYRQLGTGPGIILLHGGARARRAIRSLALHCLMRSPSIFQIAVVGV